MPLTLARHLHLGFQEATHVGHGQQITEVLHDGILDELRISNIARPLNWVVFEHANTYEADQEISFGNEATMQFFNEYVADCCCHLLCGLPAYP